MRPSTFSCQEGYLTNMQHYIELIKRSFLSVLMVAASVALIASPVGAAKCPEVNLLAYPAWYNGLECDAQGTPAPTSLDAVWVIVLNIVQWLIVTVGYVALYFIIWGGFKYITAAGDSSKITSAKGAITNAVIGLVIALAAVMIVRTVQGAVYGKMV